MSADAVLERGGDVAEAALTDVRFAGSVLTGAEFSKAVLKGVNLRGSTIDGLRGAIDLAGVVIDSAQMIPLALSLFAALGIAIDDGDDNSD